MERLLRQDEVQEIVGFSKSHINDLIREGCFPAPVRINKSVRWPESVLDSWIQEKIKQSTNTLEKFA